MTNLLAFAWKLTDAERKLIAEAMRRHDPGKPEIDYNDLGMIGLLNRESVVKALWLYGTNAAIDLALRLQGG